MTSCDVCILYSDIDGLYNANPRQASAHRVATQGVSICMVLRGGLVVR